jgi:hypothetical protein
MIFMRPELCRIEQVFAIGQPMWARLQLWHIAVSVLNLPFIQCVVPQTKGKLLEETQHEPAYRNIKVRL